MNNEPAWAEPTAGSRIYTVADTVADIPKTACVAFQGERPGTQANS
jgi:hypothetical protein